MIQKRNIVPETSSSLLEYRIAIFVTSFKSSISIRGFYTGILYENYCSIQNRTSTSIKINVRQLSVRPRTAFLIYFLSPEQESILVRFLICYLSLVHRRATGAVPSRGPIQFTLVITKPFNISSVNENMGYPKS
jgi:hypothetical protein